MGKWAGLGGSILGSGHVGSSGFKCTEGWVVLSGKVGGIGVLGGNVQKVGGTGWYRFDRQSL